MVDYDNNGKWFEKVLMEMERFQTDEKLENPFRILIYDDGSGLFQDHSFDDIDGSEFDSIREAYEWIRRQQ